MAWPTPLAAAKAVIGAHPALVALDADAAAIVAATIDRASPFPPFPNGLGEPNIVVNVPFRFMTR